jgi:hypothetical protein
LTVGEILDIKNIAITAGVTVLLVGGISVYEIYKFEQAQKQEAINQGNIQEKKLNEFLNRASSSYISQTDFDSFVKNQGLDINAIKSDLKTLNGQIKGITTTSTQTVVQQYITGGNYIPIPLPPDIKPNTDPNNYYAHSDTISLSEEFPDKIKVPFGSTTFSAQNPPGKEWGVSVLPRKYTYNTVITNTEDRERLVTYNQMSINVDGKDYKIPTESSTQEIYPEHKWRFHVHPSLFAGLGYGTNGISAPMGISVSLFSYGQYAKSPEFTFLDLGVAYEGSSKNFDVTIVPVSYNIGNVLKFLSNTYVIAGIDYGVFTKYVSGFIGLKVEL